MAKCDRIWVGRRFCAAWIVALCFVYYGLPFDFGRIAPAADDVLVRAQVVDDTTNQPVELFRVLPGVPFDGVRPNSVAVWQPHLIREAKDGQFAWPSRRSYSVFRLRFEARGYTPFVTAWLRKDGGMKSIEVRMQRDPGIHGRVLTPDDKPAGGAMLALAMANREVRLDNGRIVGADEPLPDKLADQWRRPRIFIADELGRCRLDTEPSLAVLVVTHRSGFADLPVDDLEFDTPIRLRPWGSIDGVVRWHDQLGQGEALSLIVSRDYRYPGLLSASADVTADDEGKFQFEKLPPGPVQLSRVFRLSDGKSSHFFPYAHFDVEAGPPTKVVFGGDGQVVTGQLVGLESWEGVNVRIAPNTPRPGNQQGFEAFALIKQSSIGPLFFTKDQPVQPDGTFRIEGVLPAHYQLFISSTDRRVYSVRSFIVTVPTDDKPEVDIGEIPIRVRGARKRSVETLPVQAVKRAKRVSVSGTVVDDVTGAGVKRFIIQGGKFDVDQPEDVTWGYFESRSSRASGQFSTSVQWDEGWTARIIADGYLPQPVIAEAPPAEKDRLQVVVRLKPGNWVYGRVRDHLGKPAVGVSIRAVGPTGVELGNDSVRRDDERALLATTDSNGQFELQVGQAKSLVATSNELEVWPIAMPQEGQDIDVTLPAPAKMVVFFDIEGAGDEQQIFWQLLTDRMDGFKGISVSHNESIKRQEATVFSGMTPGEYQIARYRLVRTNDMGFGRMLDRKFVSLAPGETKAIRFVRDVGTRVEGTVKRLKQVNLSHALIFVREKEKPNQKPRWMGQLELDARRTDEKGEFETEILPPGTYKLVAEGYPPLTDEQKFRSGIVGPTYVAETEITIPESGPVAKVELEFTPTSP